jgi:hypothetical protein
MQRTGPNVGESLIGGEGVTGGVSDPDDTGEDHVASVAATSEEGLKIQIRLRRQNEKVQISLV